MEALLASLDSSHLFVIHRFDQSQKAVRRLAAFSSGGLTLEVLIHWTSAAIDRLEIPPPLWTVLGIQLRWVDMPSISKSLIELFNIHCQLAFLRNCLSLSVCISCRFSYSAVHSEQVQGTPCRSQRSSV